MTSKGKGKIIKIKVSYGGGSGWFQGSVWVGYSFSGNGENGAEECPGPTHLNITSFVKKQNGVLFAKFPLC